MVRLHQGGKTGDDTDEAAEKAQDDDEHFPGDCLNVKSSPLEFQMKVARPDEGQHGASKVANETHQDGKVRNGN